MTRKQAQKAIRRQGPCGLCGGPYAAHRVIDSQLERIAAGDSIDEVADDYGVTVGWMVEQWIAYIAVLSDDLEAAGMVL